MKTRLVIVVLISMSAFVPFQASACEGLRLMLRQSSFNLTNNPNPTLSLDVQAETSVAGCSYFVTVGYGQGTTPWNRALRRGEDVWPLQISKDLSLHGALREIGEASQLEHVLSGQFVKASGRSSDVLSYRASLDLINAPKVAGTYRETVMVSLYEGTPGNHSLRDSRTMSFVSEALTKIDLKMPNQILFEGSEAEQVRSVGGELKVNAAVRVKHSSLRNGVMKNTKRAEALPYQLKTERSDQVVKLEARTGPNSRAASGDYEDEVTVTIESVE